MTKDVLTLDNKSSEGPNSRFLRWIKRLISHGLLIPKVVCTIKFRNQVWSPKLNIYIKKYNKKSFVSFSLNEIKEWQLWENRYKPVRKRIRGKQFSFPLLDSQLSALWTITCPSNRLCVRSPWLSLRAVTVPWFFVITKEGGSKVRSSFLVSSIHNHIHTALHSCCRRSGF